MGRTIDAPQKPTVTMRQLGKLLCSSVETSRDETSPSGSSVDSLDEEARLVINVDKVFRLWEQQGQHTSGTRGPRNSTPIRRRNRGGHVSETGSLPNLARDQTFDPIFDNEPSCLYKALSESDISAIKNVNGQGAVTHGQQSFVYQMTDRDSRRKPFQTLSRASSEEDIQTEGNRRRSTCSDEESHVHKTLPRYRMNVSDRHVTPMSRESSSDTDSCTDASDSSMGEFLSRVDHEKLASLLNFCERLQTEYQTERAVRNVSFLKAVTV